MWVASEVTPFSSTIFMLRPAMKSCREGTRMSKRPKKKPSNVLAMRSMTASKSGLIVPPPAPRESAPNSYAGRSLTYKPHGHPRGSTLPTYAVRHREERAFSFQSQRKLDLVRYPGSDNKRPHTPHPEHTPAKSRGTTSASDTRTIAPASGRSPPPSHAAQHQVSTRPETAAHAAA